MGTMSSELKLVDLKSNETINVAEINVSMSHINVC